MNHAQITNFIWNIADLIRDHYKRSKYPDVILPFTVLRRLDCVLAPTKERVLTVHNRFRGDLSPDALDQQLRRAAEFVFYNTSHYDFQRLLNDQDAIYANTVNYLNGFSENMRQVIENFGLRNTVETLHQAGLLYQVVQTFAQADLHPDVISNYLMGAVFEELIRRFNEASNENPGEHFTPRDVVRLMVDLLLAGDDDFVKTPGRIVKVYDPCCGTGGMLTIAQQCIREVNPTAKVYLYGQEVNPETYAVCKSDLYMKSKDGREAEGIKKGSTLSDDQHVGERFHYLITNPPYGKDWRVDKVRVEAEARLGYGGRFGAGTPRISDGQLLFLQHMLAHRFAPGRDHSRVAIIMNGSPLFTGDAGSGESEIRRWILEHDWLETIVALPEQLFYNTGIATYVWILTNKKPPHRQGKVQLIDAGDLWEPRRKSLGNKRRDVSPAHRQQIVQLYLDFTSPPVGGTGGGQHVKIFPNQAFGYRKIRVERPQRRNFCATPERVARLREERAFQNLAQSRKVDDEARAAQEAEGCRKQEAIVAALEGMAETTYMDCQEFDAALQAALEEADLDLKASIQDAIRRALSQRDEEAEMCRDSRGRSRPDKTRRDYERVPLSRTVEDYFAQEVRPHLPDAWIDEGYSDEQDGRVGRVGYEINFNRYFYRYEPPRPLDEIEADIRVVQEKIVALLEIVE
jgi:type I restriction enzyme M protein